MESTFNKNYLLPRILYETNQQSEEGRKRYGQKYNSERLYSSHALSLKVIRDCALAKRRSKKKKKRQKMRMPRNVGSKAGAQLRAIPDGSGQQASGAAGPGWREKTEPRLSRTKGTWGKPAERRAKKKLDVIKGKAELQEKQSAGAEHNVTTAHYRL